MVLAHQTPAGIFIRDVGKSHGKGIMHLRGLEVGTLGIVARITTVGIGAGIRGETPAVPVEAESAVVRLAVPPSPRVVVVLQHQHHRLFLPSVPQDIISRNRVGCTQMLRGAALPPFRGEPLQPGLVREHFRPVSEVALQHRLAPAYAAGVVEVVHRIIGVHYVADESGGGAEVVCIIRGQTVQKTVLLSQLVNLIEIVEHGYVIAGIHFHLHSIAAELKFHLRRHIFETFFQPD